ncbi:MAG: hypothetical protein FJX76_24505 [Armatimonadetes bacterium]|nr:hypothetical protein [Armatimonadota bacterium]
MVPQGKSEFDFKVNIRFPKIHGTGDITRQDDRLTINTEPNIGGKRRAVLEADPDHKGKIRLTRYDGSQYSGNFNKLDNGGVRFDDGAGHTMTFAPNKVGGFDMSSTGMGIESKYSTIISNIRGAAKE